ncbi:3'-5' exonuclease [Algoriphagus antarcticus]|uniref:DNA polymerase-3 subunit epsilon n=1 Tax=Algoriphagus antarcticus TaxID=238540 RepID=A0A3E0E316_9BACT|nr:3'-5' exonuclease [Algoriphagus antarcticus]REG92677.1 DNA polymerase-3 subunit epsilon [Algoriphagus antarcticus]
MTPRRPDCRGTKAPVSDLNNWPRLIQLAFLYYDASGNKVAEGDFIIKPDGFTISNGASRIHGITTEKALRDGQPIKGVLENFHVLVEKAKFLVAHNMAFDEMIMGSELLRNGMQNSMSDKVRICTMKQTTAFCRLSGEYGYKWPKLSELHYKLFRTGFADAHNALADISITAKCFWELRRIGRI